MFCKGIYLIFKAFMRISELVSEIYYILHTAYALQWIYYANMSLFLAPHAIVLLFLLIWGFCTSKSSKDCLSHLVFSIFTLLHPIGFPDFFFGLYAFTIKEPQNKNNLNDDEKRQKENLSTINYISKNCTLVELILQTLPQIALKTYNNFLIGSWTKIGTASVVFSCISAVFSIIMSLRVFDKESRALKRSQTRVEPISGIKQDDSCYFNSFTPV